MASKKAHHASGVAAGVLAALLVIRAGAGGPFQLLAIMALFAGAWGGTAPDWMEVAWWRSKRRRGASRLWIKHRSLTHWGVPWMLLLFGSYIMGRTICALGDAAAMPVRAMIKHFRHEFEAKIASAVKLNSTVA